MSKSESYKNIVRVASELRNTDPQAAFNLLKNLRSLVSTDAVSQDITECAGAGPAGPAGPAAPGESVSLDTQGADPPELVELGGMGEGDFDELKKELQARAEKRFHEDEVDAVEQETVLGRDLAEELRQADDDDGSQHHARDAAHATDDDDTQDENRDQ